MSHVHPNSQGKTLKLLAHWAPVIALVLLWIVYPKCLAGGNTKLDMCDTLWYDRFTSHVGYRIPVVAVVKLLKAIFPGMTSFQCGTVLSAVGMMGLLGLLRKYFRTWHGKDPSNLTLVLWCVMSPSILLLAAQVSTDFLSGLLAMWVLMELEWERVNQRLSRVRFLTLLRWAFLLVLSFSVKETIIFLWAAYGLVFLWHEARRLGQVLGFLGKLVGLVVAFLGVELLADYLIYGDALHKYNWIITKPHGGNGEAETQGAIQDLPLGKLMPSFRESPFNVMTFHLWNHVKLYGRMGIAGALGLLAGLVYFRRSVWAQTFVLTMVIMTLLAFTSRFLMERYFLIAIVLEIALMARLLMDVAARWPGRVTSLATAAVAVLALAISLFNFGYRYNPPLVMRNAALEQTYCCRPELCPDDPFYRADPDEAEHQVEK